MHWLAQGAAAALQLVSPGMEACDAARAAPLTPIEAGAPVTRTIRGGECHAFALAANAAVVLTVDEQDIDVVLVAGVVDGRPRLIDSPADAGWFETALVDAAPAPVQVLIRAEGPDAVSGGYELLASPADGRARGAVDLTAAAVALGAGDEGEAQVRAADAYRRAGDAWAALGEAEKAAWMRVCEARVLTGDRSRYPGDPPGAVPVLEEALAALTPGAHVTRRLRTTLELAQVLVETGQHDRARQVLSESILVSPQETSPRLLAHLHIVLGLSHHMHGELDTARALYEQAAELLRGDADPVLEAMVNNNLGGIHYQLGEPAAAFARFDLAIGANGRAGERLELAHGLFNEAMLSANIGAFDDALFTFERALGIFEQQDARADAANTRRGIGAAYYGLGDGERAREFLEEAIEEADTLMDERAAFNGRLLLGDVLRDLGDLTAAMQIHEEALQKGEAVGGRPALARAELALGRDAYLSGDARAEQLLTLAADTFRELGYRRELADALYHLALVHARGARHEDAAALLHEADDLQRAADDVRGRVLTLTRLARLESDRGDPVRALSLAEDAATLLEGATGNISNADLRASFFGSRLHPFDELVRLHFLASADGRNADRVAAALAASERSRARALKDLLSNVSARDVTPDAGDRENLLVELNGQLMRLRALHKELEESGALAPDAAPQQKASARDLEAGINEAKKALRDVQVRLDSQDRIVDADPVRSAMTAPERVDLPAVQRALPDGTQVLVFHVGAEDAWAWLIDAHSVRMVRLPPATRIAGAVHTAFRLASVAERDVTAVNDALRSLSEVLLDPLPPDGAKPRLVIVPDGILHLVPFAALPYAAQGGGPLLASFALTYSPAVTLLEDLAPRPPPALASLAVFAAPEVGGSSDTSALRGQLRDYSGDLAEILASFGPLPFSKVEARELKRLAGARRVDVYEGAAATRDAVTKGAPGGYELLHFATHALASSDFPDLAGLVLSGRDARGEPAPDLLHLREIYGLDLDADLVVLSACRTALGRNVRGEGPMSLRRAFLYAGADRVITTQWAAADDVAAELMTHFYDGLFTRGLAPADALREAQLAVRDSPDFRHPFYWAGLTLTSLSTN